MVVLKPKKILSHSVTTNEQRSGAFRNQAKETETAASVKRGKTNEIRDPIASDLAIYWQTVCVALIG